MIDQFADATDDHQFIHCDPERAAAETPFGGTIAHGFLSLSLLSAFAFETVPPLEGADMGINHGFDTVRFVTPVKTGAHIRARFFLADVKVRPSGWIADRQRRHHRDREFAEAGADRALADADLHRAEGRLMSDPNALDVSALAPYLEAAGSGVFGSSRRSRNSVPASPTRPI